MPQTRRQFIVTGAAATGITVLPFMAHSEAHGADTFETPSGNVVIHPVSHASFVMETPVGTIYVDPVGGAEAYADLPQPDLVLITHEHGDHFDAETLTALMSTGPALIVNPAVGGMLPDGMTATNTLANGDSADWRGVGIDAIPAYNTTEDRLNFHPEGRDNGYVVNLPGFRVYISGDTEDIPEIRALEGIDLAFVCMNLPFTMSAEAAASAVNEFMPTTVYPYHYRGRDNGTQDPQEFADMLNDAITAKMGGWYS